MPQDGAVVPTDRGASFLLYPRALIEELAVEVVKIDRGWTAEAAREIAVTILMIPGIGDAIRRSYSAGIGVLTRHAEGYDSPRPEDVRIHVAGRSDG